MSSRFRALLARLNRRDVPLNGTVSATVPPPDLGRPLLELRVNGIAISVPNPESLVPVIQEHSPGQYAEVRLSRFDGPSICLLRNGLSAWLMFLPEDSDPGFSSRNPLYSGSPDSKIEFLLANGQLDRYPASWLLPLERAYAALQYFLQHGARDPGITWHDDGSHSG